MFASLLLYAASFIFLVPFLQTYNSWSGYDDLSFPVKLFLAIWLTTFNTINLFCMVSILVGVGVYLFPTAMLQTALSLLALMVSERTMSSIYFLIRLDQGYPVLDSGDGSHHLTERAVYADRLTAERGYLPANIPEEPADPTNLENPA